MVLVKVRVCLIVLMVKEVGIGLFSFCINFLNFLWFLVWLIEVSLVFSSLIFSLFRILVFERVMVRFNLICFFKVGKRVLGVFWCKIWVKVVIVSGLM